MRSLLGAAEVLPKRTVRTTDLDDLPPPVRRYLRHVLETGQPYAHTVRLTQHGSFRDGGAADPWYDFTATQHVTTRPPGFVWDASIDMIPGVPVRVLDAYHDGRGTLHARLGGVLTVANPEPGPALTEGELMRYLAETPLYPTALLPGSGVTWTPIDDRSARATITDRGTTAALTFHFNEQNEIERVVGRRAYTTADGPVERRPWKGYWRNYQPRNGLRIPLDGEVAWIHPEGEVSYWRGHLDSIEHRTTTNPRSPTSVSLNWSPLLAAPS